MNSLKAYVSIIKGIARYRLVQLNHKYYLVDLEENPRFFFLPFITWLHIYTLYELEEGQARKIFDYNEAKGPAGIDSFSIYYFLIVGIGLVLGKTIVSSGIAYIPFLANPFVQALFLLLTVAAVLYFRYVEHGKTHIKMHQLVDLSTLNRKYVRFYPVNKLNYIFCLLHWLTLLGLIVLALGLFLQLNLLLGLIGFWVFLSMAVLTYRLFIHPNYVYKCNFYK